MSEAGLARISEMLAGQTVRPPQAVHVLAPRNGATAWTAGTVKGELREAFAVIAQAPGRVGPAGARCSMPAPVQDYFAAYGAADARPGRGAPEAWRITRAEQALSWLLLVEDDRDRKLVGAACCGASVRRLAARDKRSKSAVDRVIRVELARIAGALNRRGWA